MTFIDGNGVKRCIAWFMSFLMLVQLPLLYAAEAGRVFKTAGRSLPVSQQTKTPLSSSTLKDKPLTKIPQKKNHKNKEHKKSAHPKKLLTAGHGGASSIVSNSFNFSSMYSGHVDSRTGSYSFSATLGKVFGNGGFGPNFNYSIHYSTSNVKNSGYGYGWSDSLSRYNKHTHMLSLSTGGSYRIIWGHKKNRLVPTIRYYKLDNLHLIGPTGHYLLIAVHKDGSREYFNQYGYLARIENPRGNSLTFHYVLPYNTGKLDSITEDAAENSAIPSANTQKGKIMLKVDYGHDGITVKSLRANGKMKQVKVVIDGSHLQHIDFNGGHTFVHFHYMDVLDFSNLIDWVKSSTGTNEKLQYITLNVPTGGPVSHLYAVKTYTKNPGHGQPVVHYAYHYGGGNGHNYLGYADGVSFRADVDNLYLHNDRYTYQSTTSSLPGLREVSTYNKYHLTLSQKQYDKITGQLVSELDYTYPNWHGKNTTIQSLPDNYSLATSATTVAYNDVSGAIAGKKTTISYQYDKQGNPLSKTMPDGSKQQDTYGPADSNGFINYPVESMTYPAEPAGTPKVTPNKRDMTYTTLASLDPTLGKILTLPLAVKAFYQDAQGHWIATATKSYTYDTSPASPSYGMPVSEDVSVAGDASKGSKTKITYAYNQSLTINGVAYPVNLLTTQIFSPSGALGPKQQVYTSNLTGKTLMKVDALGNKTVYLRDVLGRTVQVIADYGQPDQASVHYTYRSDGVENSLITTAVNGYQSKVTFDGMGRKLTTQVEHVNAEGKGIPSKWDTLSSTLYNTSGFALKKTTYDSDDQGHAWHHTSTYHYDELNRRTSVSDNFGHAKVMGHDVTGPFMFNYSLSSSNKQAMTGSLCTIDTSQGLAPHGCTVKHLTVSHYNINGKVDAKYMFSMDPEITKNGAPVYTGSLKTELQAHLTSDMGAGRAFNKAWLIGWLRRAIAAKAYYTVSTTEYDGYHRVIKSVNTDGYPTRFVYDAKGNLVQKVLASGHTQSYQYDAVGNLTSVGNVIAGKTVALGSRDYNYAGDLIKSTSVEGSVDGSSWTYHYNNNNQLTSYTTPNGYTINNTYDHDGRILSRSVSGKTQETVNDRYDSVTGWLLSAQDKTGTTHYHYADNGRLLSVSHDQTDAVQGQATPVYTASFTYTVAGRALKKVDVAKNVTAYVYDSQGRLSTVNYNGKPLTHYTYAVSGEMQRSVRGPVSSEYTYNTLGQLSDYQTQVMNDQGKQIATLNYAFSYAPDGNLLVRKKSGSSGTATEHYAYDAVDNLQDYLCEGAACPKDQIGNTINSQHYSFDDWNNISSVVTQFSGSKGPGSNTTTYQFDSTDPIRLTGYTNSDSAYGNSSHITYDKDGNMTTGEKNNTLTYTPFDQVASATQEEGEGKSEGVVHYEYNGGHVQVAETAPGQSPMYFDYVGGTAECHGAGW